MKILFAASEAVPFIKTGGLADVAGSLPKALAQEGHDVKVILPLYEGVGEQWRSQMKFEQYYNVTLSWRHVYCGVFSLEQDGVTYWFVDNEYYFKRWQLYGHFDDCERFAYFSRAVVETPGQLDWSPDIIHCNDWQTALIPVYLLEDKYRTPQLNHVKTVFTIHNVEYQGRYGDQVLEDVIGLGHTYFNEGMLAHQGDVNLMKGAIMASTYVTTVSPTYAQELRLPFYAHGLAGVINEQSGKLQGILNGIDTDSYNPETDPDIYAHYTAEDPSGKAENKRALQERLGLPHPEYGHVPLLLAPDGRRLAKRDRDQELGALQSCYSAQELVGQLALLAGLIPEYAPISPAELIPLFSWEKLPQADCAVHWADGICTFFTKTIQSPVQRDLPPV